MTGRAALFDVDSRDDPLAPGPDYSFRPRVKAVAAGLGRTIGAAERAAPAVVTVVMRCMNICKNRVCSLTLENGSLTVPSDVPPAEAVGLLRARRTEVARIELERRDCRQPNTPVTIGPPVAAGQRPISDVFVLNPAAAAVVNELAADRWYVVGTSLPGCLATIVNGLLAHRQRVAVVADAVHDVPARLEPDAPPEFPRPIREEDVRALAALHLERFRAAGAEIVHTDEAVAHFGRFAAAARAVA